MDELQNIFNEIMDQNRGCREAMLSFIASREAIAFVGAGLSSDPSLGYPSWKDLLKRLSIAANKLAPFRLSNEANNGPLQLAEEIRSHFESHNKMDEFKNVLSREYGPRPQLNYTSTHERLVQLPFRAFVTTNYDACLEHAINELHVARRERTRYDIATHIKLPGGARHLVSKFLRSVSDSFDMSRRYVAHLHGWHEDPDSIILTASQYFQAYGFETQAGKVTNREPRSTIHRDLAWALFATRKLVFFGCSMDDPYIMELLKIVTKDLWEIGQPIHFVVLPIDQCSAALADTQIDKFRQYGLRVVFFDNRDGTFSKLDQLLDLAGAQHPPVETCRSNAGSGDVGTGKLSLNRAPSMHSVSLDWLDEVNESTVKDLKNEN